MWRTPFGFPVDPEVYRIKRGSSDSIGSGSHSDGTVLASSSHRRSRSVFHPTDAPVRVTTSTLVQSGHRSRAWSTLALSGIALFPRTPSSAVIKKDDSQSMILSARESGENPPNTTECIAPIRAQASIA